MCAASSAMSGSGVSARPPGPPSSVGISEVRNRPPKMRWSTNRSCSGMPSAGLSRSRTFRCFSSGTPGSCMSSWPDMPRWAMSATAGGRLAAAAAGDVAGTAAGVSASGIQRNLPRRTTSRTRAPSRLPAKSSGPRACRRRERGSSTSTDGDGPAPHPAHQAAPDHLDLGQFRQRRCLAAGLGLQLLRLGSRPRDLARHGAVSRRQASAAASCSASFLELPVPVP